MSVVVKRQPVYLSADARRVIARPSFFGEPERVASLVERLAVLDDEAVELALNQVLREFAKRHRNIARVFERNFNDIGNHLPSVDPKWSALSRKRRLLIGAYFSREYSVESAALFNPSMVADPYQGNLAEGELRVIISLRAVGEGHLSSIVFRGGVLGRDNELKIEPPGPLVDLPETVQHDVYEKHAFVEELHRLDVNGEVIRSVMNRLGETFLYDELASAVEEVRRDSRDSENRHDAIELIDSAALSHYELSFSLDTAISERVIFPNSQTESNGIEDARFVRFIDDSGEITYYATYTAYNGRTIFPKLLETKDFYHFIALPLHGSQVKNKGMALFPRKINGKYVMLSRIDGVNNFIMFSDTVQSWTEARRLHGPEYPWQFVQVGNCGSPLETEEGWIVIIHGVGPMRQYALGMLLLDLEDPSRVIGQLSEPLLRSNEEEREGYVPNVLYSCGSIIHNGEIVIPYGISDSASTFASVPLDGVLEELKRSR